MKKVLFILVICLITLSFKDTYSQINKSLLDTTKQWNTFVGYGFPGVSYTMVNRIGEDTIVNNLTYKKVYTSEYWWDDTSLSNWTCNNLIREDSNIVYLYSVGQDNVFDEVVIYNFNLSVGDSFSAPIVSKGRFYGSYLSSNLIVDSIDYIEIDNTELKRIVFNIPTYEWIEGIGSKQGFLESNNPNQDPTTYLLCAYQNQENIFHHPFAENCLISLDIDEIHKRKDIIIYPTLFDNEVNIKSEVMDYSVGLYDIYGRSIFYKKTQKENLQINTSDLSKGIYLILIKDKTNNPIKVQKLIKN